jgi:hypothetical protein
MGKPTRSARAPGNSKGNRYQEDEANLKENRQANYKANHHHGPVNVLFAEEPNQRVRNAVCAARLGHHLTEHGAQTHYDRNVSKGIANAGFKRFHNSLKRHACDHRQCQRGDKQSNEGVELVNGDEKNERNDGAKCGDKQKCAVMVDHKGRAIDSLSTRWNFLD